MKRIFITGMMFWGWFAGAVQAQGTFGLVTDDLRKKSTTTEQAKYGGGSSSLQYGVYTKGFHEAAFVIEAAAENKSDESIMVFPNAAQNELIVKIYDLYKGMLRVQLNTQGDLLHEAIFDSAQSVHRVNFSALSAGTYWLDVIELDKENIVHRYKVKYNP